MGETHLHACDAAMERATVLARQAEATEDPAARYASANLAQVYVSMARELRLGSSKSRKYSDIGPSDIGLPQPPRPEPVPPVEGGTLPQPPFVGHSEVAAPQL
jgi:hypothetical protein